MDHEFLLLVAGGLVLAVAAPVFARRTGVASPLLLVVFGIAASYVPATPVVHVEPELVLAGVLPPLLYSAAVNLPVIDVRRNLELITWLSMVMVVVTALVVGAAVHLLFPSISLGLAVALGAVVSPTDAVAATAIGRRVGLPPRLVAVLEGESLVNDASALVVLRAAVATLAATSSFALGPTVLAFAWAVLGAVLVGLLVGWVTVRVRERLDDPVLTTTVSLAVPFLAFFPAEEVGASGVLSVVVAGLLTGALGSRRFPARDRQTQATTWSTVNFVLESALFLVMGYQMPELLQAAQEESTLGRVVLLVVLVLALLVVLRVLSLAWPVLLVRLGPDDRGDQMRERFGAFEQRLDEMSPDGPRQERRVAWARRRLARGRADVEFEEREPITARGGLVLAWAGMRGGVTVAAAQTIPVGTPERATVVLAAFLTALTTLVVFGLSLPWLIRRLRLPGQSTEEARDSVRDLLARIGESAWTDVGPLEEQEVDGAPLDDEVVTVMRDRVLPRMLAAVERPTTPVGTAEQVLVVQRRYLAAMRDALAIERSIGAHGSATYRDAERVLDELERRMDQR